MIVLKRFAEWVINYKKKISRNLAVKIFLLFLLILLALCSIIYFLVSQFIPYANEGLARRRLDIQSKTLISELRQCSAIESRTLFARFMRDTGSEIFLLDSKHNTIDLFTLSVIDTKIQQGQEYPFRFLGSDKEYILVVCFNSMRSMEIKNAIWRSLPWVGGAIMILSLISAFFFSRYVARPIIRMSKIAANIAELDFSWYCPDVREDEIGILAKSINELSDKLNNALSLLKEQNSFLENEITLEKERERRRMLFFSAVSHELKTPIAIVIGQIEGMQANIGAYKDKDKYMARSAKILRSLDGFIKEILSISYIDIVDEKSYEIINLSDILNSLLEDSQIFEESHSVRFTAEIVPGAFVTGHEILLKKALKNVIENAIFHSSKDGVVFIKLKEEQKNFILTVINSESQIAEEHLSHLFEAFYRTGMNHDKYGHGSGLGLYITRLILENHSVWHTIENSESGVVFTAIFPTAASTPHKKQISSTETS